MTAWDDVDRARFRVLRRREAGIELLARAVVARGLEADEIDVALNRWVPGLVPLEWRTARLGLIDLAERAKDGRL